MLSADWVLAQLTSTLLITQGDVSSSTLKWIILLFKGWREVMNSSRHCIKKKLKLHSYERIHGRLTWVWQKKLSCIILILVVVVDGLVAKGRQPAFFLMGKDGGVEAQFISTNNAHEWLKWPNIMDDSPFTISIHYRFITDSLIHLWENFINNHLIVKNFHPRY